MVSKAPAKIIPIAIVNLKEFVTYPILFTIDLLFYLFVFI